MTDEMINKIAAAVGKSPEETRAMLNKNPKLKRLLSEMSEQDAQRLMSILGDKDSVAKILATPQARQMMEELGNRGKK